MLLFDYFWNKEEGIGILPLFWSMNWLLSSIIAFASAAIASMGIGGGAVLLLFLTVFSDIPLATAQGINLLFFLPIGAVALLFHQKSGLLQIKKGVVCGLWGLPGVFLGVWIASRMESFVLSKLFAIFLFYLGLKTFFSKNTKKPRKKRDAPSEDTVWEWCCILFLGENLYPQDFVHGFSFGQLVD